MMIVRLIAMVLTGLWWLLGIPIRASIAIAQWQWYTGGGPFGPPQSRAEQIARFVGACALCLFWWLVFAAASVAAVFALKFGLVFGA